MTGHSQPARLAIAGAYIAAFVPLGFYINGSFPPPLGIDGLWFYAAIAGILLGELLLEPFFTRPADAIANGVALALAAAGANTLGSTLATDVTRTGQLLLIVAGLAVSAIAAVAIAFKDQPGALNALAAIATAIAGGLGRAKFLFSVLLVASAYAAFADDSTRLAVLLVAWATAFFGRPLERILAWWERALPRFRERGGGIVRAIEEPMMLIVDLPGSSTWRLGDSVDIPELGTAGTLVDLTSLAPNPRARIAVDKPVAVRPGTTIRPKRADRTDPVIGYVAEGSSIDELAIRAIPMAGDLGLTEGRIVSAALAGKDVLYQVTGAQALRRVDASVTRGLIRVDARKLGAWDTRSRRFEPAPWLPTPGTAVRLVASNQPLYNSAAIGTVPGTEFQVEIDLHTVVTHNTAILGILGVGKTMLAWELIQRLLSEDVKVVVLDITDQYTSRNGFADIFSSEQQTELQQAVIDEIAELRSNTDLADGEAGNVQPFRELIQRLLREFMRGESSLLVLNPLALDVSRIDVKYGRRDERSVIGLTAVEITRIVSEALLMLARESGLTDDGRARLCLVLEEAHSLVPEWNSTADKIEQRAAVGTVRAVLQGRKYGLGCIVVTQRTANVAKSILNQCNTVFAMRVFDATGMEFLENYIGSAYSKLLATIQRAQAVAYGAALGSNVPLLINVNQRSTFLESFWKDRGKAVKATDAAALLSVITTGAPDEEDEDDEQEDEMDVDDIPF